VQSPKEGLLPNGGCDTATRCTDLRISLWPAHVPAVKLSSRFGALVCGRDEAQKMACHWARSLQAHLVICWHSRTKGLGGTHNPRSDQCHHKIAGASPHHPNNCLNTVVVEVQTVLTELQCLGLTGTVENSHNRGITELATAMHCTTPVCNPTCAPQQQPLDITCAAFRPAPPCDPH
jgi:hypothetical protein